MRIAIVSDAWLPQVNGVVRTLRTTTEHLTTLGHEVVLVTPDRFRTVPCPTYPEIRLAIGASAGVTQILGDGRPDAIHIATEGPLGWAARRWCLRQQVPFTTSLHTRFPDYLALRTRLPAKLFWPALIRFHAPASAVFVATASLARELAARGIAHTHRWSRGVDLALFGSTAAPSHRLAGLPRPIQLYVGRVAVEKNIAAFLELDTAGTKVVVGDGPAARMLAARHPAVVFTGALHGTALAEAFAAADVFAFPSRTDTFGLVMIEALASGVPVAAFPVAGPLDIVGLGGRGASGRATIGALDEDLGVAIANALNADRAACRAEGASYSWARCTEQFLAGLHAVGAVGCHNAASVAPASRVWPRRRFANGEVPRARAGSSASK